MVCIATHNGSFHADDIFAVATLKLLLEGEAVDVMRTRDDGVIQEADYVVDVGGVFDPERKRFDHHQADFTETRENGIPYAAFGLVWREFGARLCDSSAVVECIDRDLVQSIDAPDNGVEIVDIHYDNLQPFSIHHIVHTFAPTWKEDEGMRDTVFEELVGWAMHLLKRRIARTRDRIDGEAFVKRAYKEASDKRIIELDRNYPWQEVLTRYDEPRYVIKPTSSGDRWMARAVPTRAYGMEVRHTLPESWRGLRDEALQAATGIKTAVFAHRGGHMVVADDKAGARALVHIALDDGRD